MLRAGSELLLLLLSSVAFAGAGSRHGPADTVRAPVVRCGLNFVDSNNSMARTDFQQELASVRSLANLTRANTMTIVVENFQENASSTTIFYNYSCCTMSEQTILAVAAQAQAKGMDVVLKPHILLKCNRLDDPPTCPVSYNNSRADIGLYPPFTSDQWAAWFASYTEMITHYAGIAAQIPNLSGFVVGTELPSTISKDEEWAAVSAAVRARFASAGWRDAETGATAPPLLFAASWATSPQRNWSSFDEIGVDAYIPLDSRKNASSEVPSVAELVEAWQPHKALFRNMSQTWGKPLGFTELGYASSTFCATRPFHPVTWKPSDACQTNAYQAVYDVFAGEPWWWGVQWWSWRAANGAPAPGDLSLIIRGKPAMAVVLEACSGGNQSR